MSRHIQQPQNSEPAVSEQEPPEDTTTDTENDNSGSSGVLVPENLNTPSAPPSALSSSAPQKNPSGKKGDGRIVRETLTALAEKRFIAIRNNAYLRNDTKHSNKKTVSEMNKPPDFKYKKTGKPLVLIYHTHATESFEDFKRDYYKKSFRTRTTDGNLNITRIGREIAQILTNEGIGVVHDATLHDYPSYNGSYDRSADTVKKALKQHPGIQAVIDVHRDSIQRPNTDRVAPVAKVNGKNAAQLMLISGCDNGTFGFPDYWKNLRFSASVQQRLEADYPGITRPLSFTYKKYNQHLSPNSFLLEVGSNSNTLEEALYSARLFAASFAAALKEM